MAAPFYKVIACEIALREICHVVSRSTSLVDLEFLTQGLHDTPCTGCVEIQKRVDAVPAGRYDAILIGYGLCGNLIKGLRARHTPLVVPRAHDCITFFLGSKEVYAHRNLEHSGSYYYTSGWLECLRKRGETTAPMSTGFLPTRASTGADTGALLEAWTAKYGADGARYLMETMDEWTRHYTHGALIDFEFTQPLGLRKEVEAQCSRRGWSYEEIRGDLGLLQRWVDGDWSESEFLVLGAGAQVAPSHDEAVVKSEPVSEAVSEADGKPISSTKIS